MGGRIGWVQIDRVLEAEPGLLPVEVGNLLSGTVSILVEYAFPGGDQPGAERTCQQRQRRKAADRMLLPLQALVEIPIRDDCGLVEIGIALRTPERIAH